MTRHMHPSPATSTTFSCQLSSTLMAAPVDSFDAPGLPANRVEPVGWGVMRVGVRGALPADGDNNDDDDDVDDDEDDAAIPLYL